jgi:hypothetical protein
MRSIIILFTGALLVTTSCSVHKKTAREITTEESEIYQRTLIGEVDIDVTKKITGSATASAKVPLEEIIELAKWEAIESGKCDLIFEPIFAITFSKKNITVVATGFPAKYKAVKLATEDDIYNYIHASLITSTGILDISFTQFKGYYSRLIERAGIPEEEQVDIYDLYEFYDNQRSIAQKVKDQNEREERIRVAKMKLGF